MEKKFINGEYLTIDEAYKKHERLIWTVVNRFKGAAKSSKFSFEDLFMIGCEGFVRSFKYFDYDKFPVRFSTYAMPMIQGTIQRYLRDKADVINFSRSIKDLAFKIIKDDLLDQDRRSIAEIFDVSTKDVDAVFIFLANREIPSLETPTNIESDGSDTSLGDMIGDRRFFDDTNIHVQEFLESLDENIRITVEMTMKDRPQREIAKTLGVTQAQVSRYLKRAKPLAASFFNYKQRSTQNKEESEKMTKTTKGNLELAKKLLETTNKSVGEIAEETSCSYGAVDYWKKKIRNKNKPEISISRDPVATETVAQETDAVVTALNEHESNREKIIKESKIDFQYSIKNNNLSPSDLHVLFTQVGHAAASSGVEKLDVNLSISVSD